MATNETEVLKLLTTIPDQMSISVIDITHKKLVVFCNFGENMDTGIARMALWFSRQSEFNTVVIEDLNGVDVEYRKRK